MQSNGAGLSRNIIWTAPQSSMVDPAFEKGGGLCENFKLTDFSNSFTLNK